MKLTSTLTILPLLATVRGCIETRKPVIDEETKTLAQLYQEAINEGGNLVVYHGGDTPDQQNYTADAFKAKFPDINLTMIVDYSKY
ncbi:hypothetical protein DYB28_015539, partial [Aphanomyces astaci]